MRFSSATTAPSPIWPLPKLLDCGVANYRIEVHFRDQKKLNSSDEWMWDKCGRKVVDVVMAPKESEAVSAALKYVFHLAREGYRREMIGHTVIYWHRSLCCFKLKDRPGWRPDTIMCSWDV